MNKLIKYFNENYSKEYGKISYPRTTIQIYRVYQAIKSYGINDNKLVELLHNVKLPKPRNTEEWELYVYCLYNMDDSELERKIKDVPKKTIVEDNKLYLVKSDGTKIGEGTELPSIDVSKEYVDTSLENKVDKVTGKGLSTVDFTTAYETKLKGLENYNDTTIKEDIQTLNSQFKDIANKKIRFYDNVNAMKTDSKLNNNMVAITLGYYSTNDGGGGIYKIREKINSDVDNGGNINEINNGKIAELINFSPNKYNINVNQWGILPNNQDISPRISKIFTDNPYTNDLILYFPSGTYIFNTPVTCSNNSFTIIGDKNLFIPNIDEDNNCGTYFKIKSQPNSIFLDFVANNCFRVTIKNIGFISDAYSLNEDRSKLENDKENVYTETINTQSFSCLKLNYNSYVENCYFNGFSDTAIISKSWNYINSCSFENCANIIKTGIDSIISNIRFTHVKTGIIINGSANLLSNIRGDSIYNHGIYFDNGNGNCRGNCIDNLNLDFCYYSGVVLDGDGNTINSGVIGRTAVYYSGVEYNENTIELEKASAIYVKNVLNSSLSDCKVDCSLTYSFSLDGTLTEAQKKLKSPLVKIGIESGTFNNFIFNLRGNNSLVEKSTTNPSSPLTLNEFKRVISVNKNATQLNFRGFINYKGINYYLANLEIDYDVKKIITDTDLPFAESAWNGELSTIVNKSGVINKHTGDNKYYISKCDNGTITWIPLSQEGSK